MQKNLSYLAKISCIFSLSNVTLYVRLGVGFSVNCLAFAGVKIGVQSELAAVAVVSLSHSSCIFRQQNCAAKNA